MSDALFRGVNCCQLAGKHAHCRARTLNSPRKHRFRPQNRKPSFFHSQRSGESTKIQPGLLINALFTHKRSNTANLITMSQSAKASASTFDETLTLPRGFRFAGIACGLKASGKKDVALVVADHPVTASGVYTQNQIVAAPVLNSRRKTPSSSVQAVVANSGNANACTGQQGVEDAALMCQQVANLLAVDPDQVLVLSTGVIGVNLEMEKIHQGIDGAFANLHPTAEHFLSAADAICTTDQSSKVASRSLVINGTKVEILGMAKGAGMIAPNMATMLAVITTDIQLSQTQADSMVKTATDESFNRISVDGHTSTNDTVLLLASGDAKVTLDDESSSVFQEQLNDLFTELAKQIVLDGEGAQYIMAIEVLGARDDNDAFEIAEKVAASQLVKTAITGSDPNWGRIVSAAGCAKASIDPELTSLELCGKTIYQNGSPADFDAAELSGKMKSHREVPIVLRVGNGQGRARYWSSDLTTAYVEFNSEYTT